MGLDAVEIVLDVEEAFGVKIPDDRAGTIRTVGDVFDVIVESCPKRSATNRFCLSSATFRLIRREVIGLLGYDTRFGPRDSVDSVIPRRQRRRFWSHLQKRLDAKLPSLIRPQRLTLLLTITAIAAAVVCAMWASRVVGPVAIIVGVAALLFFGVTFALLTKPFATRPAATYATFRGLTNVVIAHNHSKLSERFDTWDTKDVWNALCVILVEQLDVKPDAVTREARLVEDLGME
jgi:acyl carrier protein